MAWRTARTCTIYLTQDATSADLSDAAVRNARTVSSEELRQWLKVDVVHALKEVVILDTCAAGADLGDLVQPAEASGCRATRCEHWRS